MAIAAYTALEDGNTDIRLNGEYAIHVFGTWGSATLKLQGSLDGGTTYTDISGLSWSANAYTTFKTAGNIRINVSGGTGESLNVYLEEIKTK